MSALRIGTRRSSLAQAQADSVAVVLRDRLNCDVVLVPLRSDGDDTTRSLSEVGGQGVFVSSVRAALLRGDVDLAVHSLKDIPTAPDASLVLAAIPSREDPRDALVARGGLTLTELPAGATVGTGSPRRRAQLDALGFGLHVVDLRGNVDSRIRRVDDGELDAVVLAVAGLVRLGCRDRISETLDPLLMLPAPGQGALAVEVAASNAELATEVEAVLDDASTRAAVTAERALLAHLEAGCSAPVGALAEVAEGDDGDELWLRGLVAAPDGSSVVRLSLTGHPSDAAVIGTRLAESLLSEGAADLVPGGVP
jgi:hydroxymethylbilane synthase